MTTVLTVGGANFGLADGVGRAMGGYVRERREHRVKIGPAQPPWPFSLAKRVAEQQYENLRAAEREARESGRPYELVGTSSGAERIAELLDEINQQDDAPSPEQLTRVVLLGCASSQHGGVGGVGFRGPRQPIPSTRYTTLVVARRWDGWANADNWPDTEDVTAQHRSRLAWGMLLDHARYDSVRLEECAIRAVEGNTTWLVAP